MTHHLFWSLIRFDPKRRCEVIAGFTTESPSKRFVILAESGKCENLLQALETRVANGYRVVQCWGSGGGQGLLGSSSNTTYVLLEKVDKS